MSELPRGGISAKIREIENKMFRAINRGLVYGAKAGKHEVVEVLDRTTPPPVWRGTMREAFDVVDHKLGHKPGVQAQLLNSATSAHSGAKYFSVLEAGHSGQAMPPHEPLYEWVHSRIAPAASEHEAKRITFAVRRKLAKVGLKPRHIMHRAFPEVAEKTIVKVIARCDAQWGRIQ